MTRALIVAFVIALAPSAGAAEPAIRVQVDATRAPMRIVHSTLTIPAAPGPLELLYPQWIPGEHGPSGPIADLAGLVVTAAGRPVPWTRDPKNMFAFRVDVPAGAGALEVELDFLLTADAEGFTSAASASAKLAVVSWNQLVLYPRGTSARDLVCAASLRLPAGWQFGTALPVASHSGDAVTFKPVPLATLVDSPVLMGEYFRDLDLTPPGGLRHVMHVAADGLPALEMSAELQASFRKLVIEAPALFGATHYGSYHFLVTLSDHVAHFGLEHHESSDNRSWERAFVDEDRRRLMAGLLPHEIVHSWNGKYRRPATLTDADFGAPVDSSLLWVYEGLTTYLGDVLTARSGLWTQEEFLDNLALDAAAQERRAGRTWRPLLDTCVAAQVLYESRAEWANWRREVDFYPEGSLIWLEADVLIRQDTRGKRSLDDFCRGFFGGRNGPPEVRPYAFGDVVAAMNEVAPRDWKKFFEERLSRPTRAAPLGGITGAGWTLVYTDTIPERLASVETVEETTDVSHSIGLLLDDEGTIVDTVPGLPADRAGIGPGMKLLAINGRTWDPVVLRDAIRATKSGVQMELLVDNAGYVSAHALDYRDGERYPRLVRDESRPDLLSAIIAPARGGE
jgi:predicted metalloprotease with PDZ domain